MKGTIGFEEKTFDESNCVRRVAGQHGLQHTLRVLSGEAAQNFALRIVDRLDEPTDLESVCSKAAGVTDARTSNLTTTHPTES